MDGQMSWAILLSCCLSNLEKGPLVFIQTLIFVPAHHHRLQMLNLNKKLICVFMALDLFKTQFNCNSWNHPFWQNDSFVELLFNWLDPIDLLEYNISFSNYYNNLINSAHLILNLKKSKSMFQ